MSTVPVVHVDDLNDPSTVEQMLATLTGEFFAELRTRINAADKAGRDEAKANLAALADMGWRR